MKIPDSIRSIISPISWGWFLILAVMIISTGCGNRGEVENEITPTVTELISEEGIEVQQESVPEVVDACDVGAQEAALIDDQIPDWSTLPVNACYQLWLEINDDPRDYDGKAIITYTNTYRDPLEEFVFRLYPNADRIYGGTLEVTSTKISGNPVQSEIFLDDETGLLLKPDEPIQPGETILIELNFNGRLTDGFQDAPGTYGIFNYSQEENIAIYVNWYPILALRDENGWRAEPVIGIGDAVVSEVGLYLVEVAAPDDFQVVTGGSLIDQEIKEGVEISRFATGPVRDFPVITSPNFSLIQDEVESVEIRHWGLPDGDDLWDAALQASIDSVDVFNVAFGAYPYRELDIVVVPLQHASGVEYPGLFLMRDDLYTDNQGSSFLLTTIISHETAHQWWYGLIGNDVIANPWQDEALTTFSSLLYLEQFEPQVNKGTIEYFEQVKTDIESELSNSDIGQPVAEFVRQPENYSPVVYSKGAVFFLELRNKIGDEAFFAALKDYFSRYRYKIAPPESLLNAFENSCQCELDDFYSEWGVQ